jgi:hypothetical protein
MHERQLLGQTSKMQGKCFKIPSLVTWCNPSSLHVGQRANPISPKSKVCHPYHYSKCITCKKLPSQLDSLTSRFLETKNWLFFVWAPCEKRNIYMILFLVLNSELHISQAFRQHQTHQIPNPYELVVNFYSKWIVNNSYLSNYGQIAYFWTFWTFSHRGKFKNDTEPISAGRRESKNKNTIFYF